MEIMNINGDARKRIDIKRRLRKNVILKTVSDKAPISISDVSNNTGFNMPTTTNLIEELVGEGFLIKVGIGKSTGGRPPALYKLNPETKFVIGIDIGRSKTAMILTNLELSVIAKHKYETGNLENKQEVLEQIVHETDEFIAKSKIDKEQLLGIGIAFPGLLNVSEGRTITYLNFGKQQTIQQLLEDRLNVHIRIENDARAMALGEKYFGLSRKVSNALCLNLGWGVGLGILINDKIYEGSNGFAGEFGHIVVDSEGPLCHCGKRGCLETVASGNAIARIAREGLQKGADSKILDLVGDNLDLINTQIIVQAAQMGDIFSIEILEEAGIQIGKALAVLINIFNPSVVIIGGSVSRAGRFILNPIRTAASKMSFPHIFENAKIVVSELEYLAGAMGATTLITREIFETSHLDLAQYI